MVYYEYYEEGHRQVLNEFNLVSNFYSDENKEQRTQGTTFNSWIDELVKMQILVKIDITCTECGSVNDFSYSGIYKDFHLFPCNECGVNHYVAI